MIKYELYMGAVICSKSLLMHIYRIWKYGANEPICRVVIETQI